MKIKNIFLIMSGRKKFQKFFESLYKFSLAGMNIGEGGDIKSSGEKNILNYVYKYFESLNDITIFDVGANIGDYSLLLKDIFNKKGMIYSFEPSKNTFDKLKLNLENKEGIQIYNFGFSNENTEAILYSDSNESGLASLYKRRLDHFNLNMNKSENIRIRTIDDFCKEAGIKYINFLKLDVEGNELKVLLGASKMLNCGAIDLIQFEFGGCNIDSKTYFQDFFYLLNNKYNLFRIVKDGLYPISQYTEAREIFLTTNYLAIKKA